MYCVLPGVVPVQRMFLCFKLTATIEPIVSMIGIRGGDTPFFCFGCFGIMT